jgi:hypothetical protein
LAGAIENTNSTASVIGIHRDQKGLPIAIDVHGDEA